ncbi:putative electron transfer flavoprotein subunit, FAD-binding [uncultured Sporomusa sp.]|uniref:Putative electron transfer flavoprotein subunit, FAD-binding n=1 Tax=uncultured Sporomusa sp. TaxID=307249 RepID=A0A212LWM5_9FIRM|nr:FAD-binding protein [uncultured Sporomusa sp.]SCM81911.1 putative electron transfer flavoprotein subunit, FAD-binding [uncultured Sporomusa sp.]
MRILVFAERNTGLAELCNGARNLGTQVEAIVIGSQDVSINADKIYAIPAQNNVMFEDYADSIAAIIDKSEAELLLVEPTKRCKLIAGRLAAMRGTSVITDIIEITANLETKRMVYGGTAIRKEKAVGGTMFAMVSAGTLISCADTAVQGTVEAAAYIEPASKIKVVSTTQKPKVTVNLPCAKRVIGVGRGIANEKDLEMVRQLAEVVGGEIGCTRPISEAEKWLPTETYIGVSGLMLVPEVYIAIGISGQIQHTVGINRSKVVIAINKDKNAPIFKQADYGIVGDLYKVVPALIKGLKQ